MSFRVVAAEDIRCSSVKHWRRSALDRRSSALSKHCASRNDDAEFSEELGGFVERQAHHPGVAALEALDESARAPPDAVGARLVEGLAPLHVGAHAPVVHRCARYPG